jgi:hypothetical protein
MEAFNTMATARWQSLFDNLEDQGVDPRGADRERLRPYLVNFVVDSEELSTREYKRADVVRTDVLDGLQDLFEEYYSLATATLGTTMFPTARNSER